MADTVAVEVLKKKFWVLLEKYGCDFTNTFRVLSRVSKAPAMRVCDEEVLDLIVSYMVPKQGMIKNCRSQWDSEPKIAQIMKINPELLRHFGLDPGLVA
jgi:hypothetical protein